MTDELFTLHASDSGESNDSRRSLLITGDEFTQVTLSKQHGVWFTLTEAGGGTSKLVRVTYLVRTESGVHFTATDQRQHEMHCFISERAGNLHAAKRLDRYGIVDDWGEDIPVVQA